MTGCPSCSRILATAALTANSSITRRLARGRAPCQRRGVARPTLRIEMIKIMLLVSRRPDVSREAFRRYYEEHHAPLAAAHLPFLVRYVRNYVVDEFRSDLDCDCVTEFWFDHPGPWRQARDVILREDLLDLFAED